MPKKKTIPPPDDFSSEFMETDNYLISNFTS